jgi:preprotein translocase subunit YajC
MYQAASSGSGGSLLPILLIAGLFALTYFMIIRPQNRRRREMQEMQTALEPGARVVTIGGLYGRVTESDDESVYLEVAHEVEVRFSRGAIAKILENDETPKNEETPVASEESTPTTEDSAPAAG